MEIWYNEFQGTVLHYMSVSLLPKPFFFSLLLRGDCLGISVAQAWWF